MDKRVEIASRTLVMRYTVNSLCAVEERAGGSLDRLMEKQFTATRLLLWGALMDRQPEMSLGDVGALIGEHILGGGTLEQIVTMCAEALEEAGFFSPAA